MNRLRDLIRRVWPLQAGEADGQRRGVDNVDAMAADASRGRDVGQGLSPAVPPGYIKTYDEGRPKK